ITNKRHQKLASKNNNHTLNGKKNVAKNNKQKPPNTLLSSQTTDQIFSVPPLQGNPASLNHLRQRVKRLCLPAAGATRLD
ncbi:hypothetical protein, partial [Mycolicibacterium mageritense]|uniref:hypothetical protein n=1 Tax=Mycolicibacterium mageritense TaxID=53462 RepID=UPI001E63C0CD